MTQVRTRLVLSLLTLAAITASGTRMSAEMIVFTNGRTMSVRDYRVSGDTITVTLRQGGEATFSRSLVARVAPDEVPYPKAPSLASTESAHTLTTSSGTTLEARPYAALIESVALRHGIDPELVHAVIQAESNYQPNAKSEVGARGLMQVMPSTARDLGVKSAGLLFDPRQNVEAGVKYLKFLLHRFDGDVPAALAAYNAGPGAVSKYDGIPPYPETRNYVRKVLSNFQQ
jgi:soluble lytic murein transglycosylase-like protein